MKTEEKKPDNPNAFPVDGMYAGESLAKGNSGMTLRDYFAAKAMQGHLASEYGAGIQCDNYNQQMLAKAFYDMADAMLKQREL
jgi:hypothetical protein